MDDRKPLAWIGVFDGEPDPEFIWWDEAKARRWISTRPGVELAPLSIAMTLTDAEREAIKEAIACCEDITYGGEAAPEAAATLRSLLARSALSTR